MQFSRYNRFTPFRHFTVMLAGVLICTVLYAQTRAVQLMPGMDLDKIAAVAGGEIILESDLASAVLLQKSQFPPSTPDSVIRQKVLLSMIDQKLLYAKAIEDSVQVSDDEVSQQLDYRIQQFVQQYGSEKRVEEIYGKSISQIKREYRDEMKKQILGERWLQQKLGDQERITTQQVQDFYNQYKDTLDQQTIPEQADIADIAVALKPSTAAKDSARSMAEHILDSLHHGADFATMAKRYSQDSGSAVDGGDLGFQKRGIFVKDFEEAAFGLKEGQTSNVVETEFGFHIIQLLERRGEEVHVRHILIRVPKTHSDEQVALDKLQAIRDSIVHGASFGDMAQKYSDDLDTKPFGGDVGPVMMDALSPEIRASVKNMKPGDITQPIRAQITTVLSGFKIFLLKKFIPAHKPNMQQDYKQLENIATQFLQQQKIEQIMEDVRKQVFWKIESADSSVGTLH
ncbi:MAG TPA: peptidylprolyl isomerase [Candidatus Kapabacteria bacterium]|nr:peptidylprolyl isomerase [Candidatus Kapabacteria bacterium]